MVARLDSRSYTRFPPPLFSRRRILSIDLVIGGIWPRHECFFGAQVGIYYRPSLGKQYVELCILPRQEAEPILPWENLPSRLRLTDKREKERFAAADRIAR